ncbi:MAG: hypothetical protein EXS09_05920 [Gemmataceae bacterium]|nr:hypothetical protein [Gemmataceae bacterium]
MKHYSCDLCGKDLADGLAARFVLQMEVFAAHDPAEINECDLGDDHLEEMGQLLREAEEMDLEPAPAFKKMRFDMCPSCHRKFLADPLSREAQKFDFSEN